MVQDGEGHGGFAGAWAARADGRAVGSAHLTQLQESRKGDGFGSSLPPSAAGVCAKKRAVTTGGAGTSVTSRLFVLKCSS